MIKLTVLTVRSASFGKRRFTTGKNQHEPGHDTNLPDNLRPDVLAGLPGRTAQAEALPTVSVGFRNDTATAVMVQGASKVNNVPRRGQPFAVAPGKINYDNNVPLGVRFVTIYYAAQPSKILLSNGPVFVQGRATMFAITAGRLPGQVVLVPISPPLAYLHRPLLIPRRLPPLPNRPLSPILKASRDLKAAARKDLPLLRSRIRKNAGKLRGVSPHSCECGYKEK